MSTAVIDKNLSEKNMATRLPQPIPAVVREIPLDQIEPSPWNRKRFNQTQLEELAASIVETQGVVQPIVLRPCPELALRKSLVGEQYYIDVKGTKTGAEAYKNREAAEAALATLQRYQIAAGERRWRASKIARDTLGFKRDTITASVRTLTDAQAIKLTLIENAQREDVPVLELCRTYKFLLGEKQEDGSPYTREFIAAEVDKSYSLVCAILNADKAIPEVQKAAREGKIGDSLVLEIAKYTPAQQMDIFLQCFTDDYSRVSLKAIEKDKDAEPVMPVRKLRAWIAENVHIELKNAPFDTKDEFLLKGVTSCVKCPKRTGSNPGLFAESAEMQKGDTCTDPGCYDAKKQAFVQIRIAEEQQKAAGVHGADRKLEKCSECGNEPHDGHKKGCKKLAAIINLRREGESPVNPAGVKPLGAAFSQSAALATGTAAKKAAPVIEIQKISIEDLSWGEKGKAGVLHPGGYELAKPGCKKEKKAIYVDGPKIGQTAFICDVKSCSNHGYSGGGGYGGGSKAPVTFERRKEIWNQKVQCIFRDELLKNVLVKLPPAIGNAEGTLVARHIVKTLPHRDAEKVARVYGLKEGANIANYAEGLKGPELQKFIVICSLVEDLGVDGVAYGQLKGPLKLAASQYKVDDEQLLAAAKSQLEKKRPKSEAEKKEIEKLKASKPGQMLKDALKASSKNTAKSDKPPVKKAKTGKTKKKK